MRAGKEHQPYTFNIIRSIYIFLVFSYSDFTICLYLFLAQVKFDGFEVKFVYNLIAYLHFFLFFNKINRKYLGSLHPYTHFKLILFRF